jgi:hypothetical protein
MSYADKAKSGTGSSEGVITDYSFTDVFPFGDSDAKGDDDNIYLLLEVTPDGADEPNKRSLYLGSGQFLRIEDDGKTLVSSDDDGSPRLYEGGEVFKFIESLEAAGFPAESRFPDITEEKKINFEGMVDYGRVRIVNEIDEEATKKFGKRKVKKGKHKGKEFNRTFTKVTKFWAPGEEPEGGAKASKGATKTSTKATKAEPEDTDDEATEAVSNKIADRVMAGILEATKNNSIKVVDIALAVTRYASNKANKIDTDVRDTLRTQLASKDWLSDAADRDVVAYDAKKGVVSAT